MAYWRSHWTFTDDFAPVRGRVEEWARTESAKVPSFAGIWLTDDYDDPSFRWVTVEYTDPAALEGEGRAALDNFTAALEDALGDSIKKVDSEDIEYFEADELKDVPGKSYRSIWFTADDPDAVRSVLAEWQKEKLNQVGPLEKTWLVRATDGSGIHSISAEFTTKDDLYGEGLPAFDEAVERLGDLIKGEPEMHRVSGAVEITG